MPGGPTRQSWGHFSVWWLTFWVYSSSSKIPWSGHVVNVLLFLKLAYLLIVARHRSTFPLHALIHVSGETPGQITTEEYVGACLAIPIDMGASSYHTRDECPYIDECRFVVRGPLDICSGGSNCEAVNWIYCALQCKIVQLKKVVVNNHTPGWKSKRLTVKGRWALIITVLLWIVSGPDKLWESGGSLLKKLICK